MIVGYAKPHWDMDDRATKALVSSIEDYQVVTFLMGIILM